VKIITIFLFASCLSQAAVAMIPALIKKSLIVPHNLSSRTLIHLTHHYCTGKQRSPLFTEMLDTIKKGRWIYEITKYQQTVGSLSPEQLAELLSEVNSSYDDLKNKSDRSINKHRLHYLTTKILPSALSGTGIIGSFLAWKMGCPYPLSTMSGGFALGLACKIKGHLSIDDPHEELGKILHEKGHVMMIRHFLKTGGHYIEIDMS
jgi:hypothetical protein